MPMLNLLVLRCGDLAASYRFYGALGLVLEQHGSGPIHCCHRPWSPPFARARVDRDPTGNDACLVRDPDGNVVELTQLNEQTAQQAVEADGRPSS
jgi:catechol 2,3-dioxygenase-like lactoylglutathione lyase family enzyme